jgi:ethanolamine utilization protein EutA (predicted chaperonin)
MNENLNLETLQIYLESQKQNLIEEIKLNIESQKYEEASELKKILNSMQELIDSIDFSTNLKMKQKRKTLVNQIFT